MDCTALTDTHLRRIDGSYLHDLVVPRAV